ncbi:PBP1A family penicillin-binding protein [Chelatococcus sp. SYSU_G07232]|uniref:peptidoglycan glycosyltransferase n=1 Tax=Chelatococcus albus TaxID=3047466 RepID=A0ABT7AK99_9HYPH|nr:PBP1A family penicillin-binding protein [Chelatococcus sp. SYSU_G07232]MDJ1159041.1 PBP1A family penicillin-binding protein [Chelatococcus sp. SYSU_G07232]
MQFFGETSLWTRVKRAALAFDSWLDASLYEAGRRGADAWERFSSWADRLSVSGGWRLVTELADEALTLGAGGSVVLLALAVPAFRETSDDWLKQQELAVIFLDRYGNEIGKRGIRHDDSLKLEEFPDHLIKAVLATEDRRFYEHFGIDIVGTMRALSANARASGVVQGGSSITQQLAKNLFLTNERSIERKIKEAFLALWLESRLTKNEILKLYLDRAYMGGGAFGAAASAEFYFGKSVKDVTLAEAAMLAGLFKAPTRFAPHVNLPAARARANVVLSNMVEAGFLTEGQIQTARRHPATPIDRKRETSPDYYLDFAFNEVKRMADEGKLGQERVVTVKTALDASIQARAEAALENSLRQHGKEYGARQGAIVVMLPDGAVRAMVGGRDYGMSQFNRATDALRQPGSAFKPFVYATALAAGLYKPTSIVVDRPVCIGNWCPNNYSRSYAGSMPLTVALAKSINTIPVQMSLALGKGNAKVGRARIIETARAMGLTTDLKDTTSLPIGAAEVTVIDMAAGYAVFANAGRRAAPYAALEIRNARGETIWRHDRDAPQPKQVLPLSVVADMNMMLNQVVEAGTGRRAIIEGVQVAGKTGTTNAYRDAWFVGYSGNLVASVWLGNDDYSSTHNMTGGTLPAMTWHEVMAPAHQGIELKPLPGIGGTPAVAKAPAAEGESLASARAPSALSRRSFEVLGSIGDLFRSVEPGRREASITAPAALSAGGFPGGARAAGGRIGVP